MEQKETKLRRGFEYHSKDGETIKAEFITLNEFTSLHINKTSQVKQICMKAFDEMSDRAGKSDETVDNQAKITASDLISALYLSNQPVDKLFLYMKELLISKDIAFVDGESPLKRHMFESMHQDDVEEIVGDYILAFILASVIQR